MAVPTAGQRVPIQPQYPGAPPEPGTWEALYASKADAAKRAGENAGIAAKSALGALGGGAGGASGALGGLNGLVAPGGGTSGASGIAPLSMPDTSAADSASYNRTKDQVGASSAGALRGLRESLGARGMLGSGLESRGTEQIAEAGLGQLGDVSRQQQITNADKTQHAAEVNYQGAITQRGQDILAAEAAAQRNQTVLLSLLKTLGTGAGAGLSY